jgi:hypothetical protein
MEMNLRQAIKVLLINVHAHAAAGYELHPTEEKAVAMLERYTDGWVPGEPEPEWLRKAGRD